ncbi:MAG: class I SAM-dependent methyltransferase [Pseudomonadota bacterium]
MTIIDMEACLNIKGFMAEHEARRLFGVAREAAGLGPCLEIGSYCGKSAYIIGMACKEKSGVLFSIDHHQGSEEQQPGQEYFDPDLLDEVRGRVDTFPLFRDTLERFDLLDTVVPIVSGSVTAGRLWQTPLAMVFIDGGHTAEAAFNDYETWARHILPRGFLVIHDIFFDPQQGGQAPRQVYEAALGSGHYEPLDMTGTLGVLKRR